MKNFIGIGLILLSLAGCNGAYDIENGEVPEQYMEQAKVVEGAYTGKISGQNAQMQIRFEGRKPVLTITDPAGNNCESKVGDLKTVYYQRRSNPVRITGVSFDFSANQCSRSVQGDRLTFWVSDNYFDLELFAYRDWERKCEVVCHGGNMPYNPPSCTEQCRMDPVDRNIHGRFFRSSKQP